MKNLLEIPVSAGFCKNCFNQRRSGSVYCGHCEEPRFTVYCDITKNFKLLSKVRKKFDIKLYQLENLIFTYGDVIYSYSEISYGLVAHEMTHVLQQKKMGKDEWWDKYMKDEKFRLEQELEAYHNQYLCYLRSKGMLKATEILTSMAEDLSGKIYGNIINFEEAKKLIL